MRVLAPVVANLVLLLAALSFGSLLRRLLPADFSRIDRMALILLGGLGLLGTLLFCVGQLRFSRPVILLALCFCFLLGLRTLIKEVRESKASLSHLAVPVLPAAIVAIVLGIAALGGLALPVGDMNNDSIAYHYLGPSVWLRQEIIRPVPDEVLTYFPVVVEAQYAALMSLGGDRAPGLFALLSLVALLLTAASLAIRLGLDSLGAWWVAALVAAMPAVCTGAFGGMVDALFAAFVLAAARLAFDAQRLRDFAFFGLFCGFAAATKYTGIISSALLMLCCALIWFSNRGPSPGKFLRALAIAGAAAVLIASPFYLRNWILYGCPIYPPPPVLLHFFTATKISPLVLQRLLTNVTETGAGMGHGLKYFLLLPFNLTYHTANFRGAGGIGLVPLALAPFGLISRWRDPLAKGLALFGALQLTSWFLTAQVSRYLILVYVLGALFGVLGWRTVSAMGTRFGRFFASLVVAVSLAYGLFMICAGSLDGVRAALSPTFEESRILRETPWAESFAYLNRDPSVKRVLILDENVGPYFLKKDYIKPFGRWGERTMPGVANVSDLLKLLPSLPVTHVLDIKFEGGSFALADHPAGLTPVFERKDQIVYRVNAKSH